MNHHRRLRLQYNQKRLSHYLKNLPEVSFARVLLDHLPPLQSSTIDCQLQSEAAVVVHIKGL
jgi:hypothetical protein